MKALSIAALLAVTSFSIAPVFANDGVTDNTIVGRSRMAVEAALLDRGVVTSGLEEWGGLIRAWVPDANGGTSMQLFDANSLQQVSPGRS